MHRLEEDYVNGNVSVQPAGNYNSRMQAVKTVALLQVRSDGHTSEPKLERDRTGGITTER
jgi:hypothetical protein